MVPPKRGCGWQTTAASGERAEEDGVQRIASRRPAGPSRKKLRDSCVLVIDAPWTNLKFSASTEKDRMRSRFSARLFHAANADVEGNTPWHRSDAYDLGAKLAS